MMKKRLVALLGVSVMTANLIASGGVVVQASEVDVKQSGGAKRI